MASTYGPTYGDDGDDDDDSGVDVSGVDDAGCDQADNCDDCDDCDDCCGGRGGPMNKADFEQCRKLLAAEMPSSEGVTREYPIGNDRLATILDNRVEMIPILHNKDRLFLQMCGWSINLYDDGTWDWEDTTGG